jgi:asparagine synthase (glutamine-hydrolysing)
MCGILGYVLASNTSSNRKLSVDSFKNALFSIKHRGPDDFGIFTDGICYLGNTRLSIIDLSTGHQPMMYEFLGKKLWIVYNGEIYNYLEIRKELIRNGYYFKTESDTEVILAAYIHWGEKCLEKFNGMFAFAIWDENEKKLFAARDRLGKKPFYYTLTENGDFIFASEIKALNYLKIKPQINVVKFYYYLLIPEFHYLAGDEKETFFSNIYQLPAGHFLIFKNWKILIKKWWFPELIISEKSKNIRFKESQIKFLELLKDSVKLRLRSDVNIGVTLSAGLDSSSVLYCINEILGIDKEIHTFSICHPQRITNECDLIKITIDFFSKKLNIIHHFINFPSKISFDEIIDFCLQHDEPLRSFDVFNQYVLMRYINNYGIKVILGGQGGDELFWGYPRYFLRYAISGLKSINLVKFLRGSKYFKDFTGVSFWKNILPSLVSGLWPKQYIFRKIKNNKHIFRNPGLIKFYDIEKEYKKINHSNLKEFQLSELTKWHLPSLLRDEDRNSMLFGIETRAPYLDFRIVEMALRLPVEFNIKNNYTKFFIRSCFDKLLPDEIVWRKFKSGLYEKKTIDYVTNFSSLSYNLIIKSDFIKEYINLDNIDLQNKDLLWRLFNVAILDLNYEKKLPNL